MLRNEEYWVGPIVENLCQVFDKVMAFDCGSSDSTPDILKRLETLYPGVLEVSLFERMTPEANGKIRQLMTDQTKTEYAAIVDGDEWYPIEALWKLRNSEIPEEA